MMIALYWILGLVVVGLLARYVPGFKCISYCRYKSARKSLALKKLKSMCEIEESYNKQLHYTQLKTKTVNTDGYSSKKLMKLYKYSLPFGCNSFREEEWVPSAREILKERIAELQLLEA